MGGPLDKSKIIRNAATVILIRDVETRPRVLMGQRGAKAAFMPNKFVFPGGAVDLADGQVPLASAGGAEPCLTRLGEDADPALAPPACLAAAIRELWEETGQILGEPGTWPGEVPEDWAGFAEAGYIPPRPTGWPLSFARLHRPAVRAGSMRGSSWPMPRA